MQVLQVVLESRLLFELLIAQVTRPQLDVLRAHVLRHLDLLVRDVATAVCALARILHTHT